MDPPAGTPILLDYEVNGSQEAETKIEDNILSQCRSGLSLESSSGTGSLQPQAEAPELESSGPVTCNEGGGEKSEHENAGSQRNPEGAHSIVSDIEQYCWNERVHGVRLLGHIANMLDRETVAKVRDRGKDFFASGGESLLPNGQGHAAGWMDDPAYAQCLRESSPGGLLPPGSAAILNENKAFSFLQDFNWYIRVDIAGYRGAGGSHDLLLAVVKTLDGFCERIASTAGDLKLSFWPTLFVRSDSEARLSRGSEQDCGALLIGIEVVEEESPTSDESSSFHFSSLRKTQFLGCTRLGASPSDPSPCPTWERNWRESLSQVEDEIRGLGIFRQSRARGIGTSVLIRLVHPHQLEPLSALILDKLIWPVDEILDRIHMVTYVRPSTAGPGQLVKKMADFLLNVPSSLKVQPAPGPCRPFQIVAQIAMTDRKYSREWMRLLLGYFDPGGYNEVTLEAWWSLERKIQQDREKGVCGPKHYPPWRIVSIRRHKTLELLWHLALGIDRFPTASENKEQSEVTLPKRSGSRRRNLWQD